MLCFVVVVIVDFILSLFLSSLLSFHLSCVEAPAHSRLNFARVYQRTWDSHCASYLLFGEFSELTTKADRVHVNVKNGKEQKNCTSSNDEERTRWITMCAALRFQHIREVGKKSGPRTATKTTIKWKKEVSKAATQAYNPFTQEGRRGRHKTMAQHKN